jgi:hypothetical protein
VSRFREEVGLLTICPTEPAIIPFQAMGVVDVAGVDIPHSDILAHTLSNTANTPNPDFTVQRSSAFVNEYPRVNPVTGERTDGGPSDPNHLLGAFPVLYPFGKGGFEVGRDPVVSYEKHVRWALRYADRRFRKDLHFVFQVFGVIQKRQVCRSAALQINRSSFRTLEPVIAKLTSADLKRASAEETRRVPFSNPSVRALRTQLTAVRSNVMGTDESRTQIRSKIWSTTVVKGPPSLWITINPSDTHDPIAQIFAGQEIDMDAFAATAGPDGTQRAIAIAADPFAAAKFF